MDLNQWIQRYTSIWWYRMLGLDENKFLNVQKRHWLVNDINRIIQNFALENIFIEKYIHLDLFILRISVIIDSNAIEQIKLTYRKNTFCDGIILGRAKGKKFKKIKRWCKYSKTSWCKFGMQLFITS